MKLEEQLKNAIRLKHYSYRTEESYVGWYRRYVLWHGKRHPAEMGGRDGGSCNWLFPSVNFVIASAQRICAK